MCSTKRTLTSRWTFDRIESRPATAQDDRFKWRGAGEHDEGLAERAQPGAALAVQVNDDLGGAGLRIARDRDDRPPDAGTDLGEVPAATADGRRHRRRLVALDRERQRLALRECVRRNRGDESRLGLDLCGLFAFDFLLSVVLLGRLGDCLLSLFGLFGLFGLLGDFLLRDR